MDMEPILFDTSDGQQLRINMISSWFKKHYEELGLNTPAEGMRALPGYGVGAVVLGVFAGLGIGASAMMQGQAAAGAADSHAETGKGLANNMTALGVVETVAIFVMVFAMIAVGRMTVSA